MGLSRFRKRVRQGVRTRREGAAAVEFALIAAPFFLMIFAVLELGLVFLIDSTLENAVLNAGRIVRTGRAEAEGYTAARFKTALCAEMSVFAGDCATRADIDVRRMPRFRDTPPPSPIKDGVLDKSVLTFSTGEPGDLMLVRVWYSQPLVTPFMAEAVSRLKSGAAVISVTTAFRTEPYRARTP